MSNKTTDADAPVIEVPPTFEHAHFCTPRPEADAPRMEAYDITKYDPAGVQQVGAVHCVRCMECGRATYDGVLDRSVA